MSPHDIKYYDMELSNLVLTDCSNSHRQVYYVDATTIDGSNPLFYIEYVRATHKISVRSYILGYHVINISDRIIALLAANFVSIDIISYIESLTVSEIILI